MKVLRQNGNAIIMCIIEVVAGIALMVDGLFNVIRYFRSSREAISNWRRKPAPFSY